MIGIVALFLSVIAIFYADYTVKKTAKEFVFSSTDAIPYKRVGLVLGTAKYLADGNENLYYRYRIEAAVKLYKSGKVDFFLISGDNSRTDYDEPTTIKNDLIAQAVSAEKIYLDYAGFRTFDSVIRCKAVFGESNITVVSQPFHNERAIYIARHHDIAAVGFNAQDVTARYGFKTQCREKLARVKLLLDIACGKKPKFLGEPITIE